MRTVSVIVPTFNARQSIAEALHSVLGQTLPPVEILIVDDGSTDGTESVIHAFSDSRIRYLRQENRGVSAARNFGMREASGDLIAFLDADDRWLPEMLETQVALVNARSDVVCSFTNFVRFVESTRETLSDQFSYYDLERLCTIDGPLPGSRIVEGDAFSQLVQLGIIPAFTPVMMFRRAALNGLRFNESLKICEDTQFALRVYMLGAVAFTSTVLAEIRRHDSNTTLDYKMVAVHEAEALAGLDVEVKGAERRLRYQDRLVKARIDAACALMSRGNRRDSVRQMLAAFLVSGSHLRKAKGLARLALTALQG